MKTFSVFAIVLAGLAGGASLPAQDIRGRVVDDATRQALINATVLLMGADGAVLQRVGTDANGFFRVMPKTAGQYEMVVELLGYAKDRRVVNFEGRELVVPAFVLKVEAVPLKPVEATETAAPNSEKPVGFSRASMILAGSKMRTLEEHGIPFKSAVRETGSVEVKEYYASGRLVLCIQAMRRMASFSQPSGGCAWPAIVLDGITLEPSDAQKIVRGLSIAELESIEFLPPVEAAQRYGLSAAANGALVMWSRGRGPYKDAARNGK
jgi:CarboxypepD_reg-like domain